MYNSAWNKVDDRHEVSAVHLTSLESMQLIDSHGRNSFATQELVQWLQAAFFSSPVPGDDRLRVHFDPGSTTGRHSAGILNHFVQEASTVSDRVRIP